MNTFEIKFKGSGDFYITRSVMAENMAEAITRATQDEMLPAERIVEARKLQEEQK